MFVLFLILTGLVVWRIVDTTRKNAERATAQRINQQWVDYLAGYIQVAEKPSEKALLGRLLADLTTQGMPNPTFPVADKVGQAQSGHATSLARTAVAVPTRQSVASSLEGYENWLSSNRTAVTEDTLSKTKTELDNTTILLYFGAFLFVAAAGLFVAFGGASGGLRTTTVLAVALAFYFGGLWLYDNRSKLRVAALTFVGIGITLAPLVGVAAYAYLFKDQGSMVWFATSVFCLGLYWFALQKLRHPLLEYILIGTFVSLFESAVSIMHGPVYYYGWMLASCGIMLKAWSLLRRWSPELEAPTGVSAHVLLPLALFAALYMVPSYGVFQLGVALLLGAAFYALQAWESASDREVTAVVSEVLLTTSAGAFAYSYRQDVTDVALVLLGFVAFSVVTTLALAASNKLVRNSASVGLGTAVAAAVFALPLPRLTLFSVAALAAASGVTWLRQRRVDAYEIGSTALLAAPFVYVFMVRDFAELAVAKTALLAILGGVTLLQLGVFYAARKSQYDTVFWRLAFRFATITGLVIGFVVACFIGPWWAIGAAMVATVVSLVLHAPDSADEAWLSTASIFAVAPVFVSWDNPAAFLTSVSLATLCQLWLVLKYRFELSRWLGTASWLLLPLAVSHQWPKLDVALWYAGAYFAAAAGLVLARGVAQRHIGRLPATIAELERRLKSDSLSYVYGYVAASLISIGAALAAPRFTPAVMAVALGLLTYVVAVRVEKQPELLGIVPLLLQVGLWGTYRGQAEIETYALLSTTIAAAAFAYGAQVRDAASRAIQWVSLATLYITPALAIGDITSWTLPVGLFVASLATLITVWKRPQEERELAGGLLLIAVMWFLYYHGVRNTQVHTHLIAALCGLYAYWRHKRGDSDGQHSYTVAMLAAATIPLAVQAMSGQAGGLYGVWLIGEQVAIMLLGMVLRDGFVVRWGLYVAIGAVLYQLRNLGWAMVAVLAVFLIGLALFRLQRSENDSNPPQKR